MNDQFNDFLFEKTSKINLEDIKLAQANLEKEDNKKIVSPYTLMKPPKINILPVIVGIGIALALFLIIYIILISVKKAPKINDELKGVWVE